MMRKATNHGNIIYFDKVILPTHLPVDLLRCSNFIMDFKIIYSVIPLVAVDILMLIYYVWLIGCG